MEKKICKICDAEKEISLFPKHCNTCRVCFNKQSRERSKMVTNDPEKRKKRAEWKREWKKKNPPTEEQKEKARKYALERLEKYPEKKMKMRVQTREWLQKNKERVRETRNNWENHNYKNNPLHNMRRTVAIRTRFYLKKKGLVKSQTTEDMLGCNYEELKRHIESLFLDGMSWENRNEWHVDHIIPLASADTVEDVIKLSHYTNLQPLWAIDNLKKGSKLL
jgi:hypothetical protein